MTQRDRLIERKRDLKMEAIAQQDGEREQVVKGERANVCLRKRKERGGQKEKYRVGERKATEGKES